MSHTGCWVWDVRSGAPAYWSAEMSRICGRDPARGVPSAEEYRALFAPNDWPIWVSAVQRSVEEKTELDIECRLALSGGILRLVRIKAGPVVGAADTVTEIIGSVAEISDAGTDNRDQGPADVIDLIPALVWSTDPNGALYYCNKAWLDYTGLTAERAMDSGWKDAMHRELSVSMYGPG